MADGIIRNDREKVLGNLRRRAAVFPDGIPEPPTREDSFTQRFFPDDSGDDLPTRFLRKMEANAATTTRVAKMEDIPAAAAEWLRRRGCKGDLRLTCAGDLAELDWSAAGIAAECRAAADGDEAGATQALAAAADTGAMLQVSDGGHSLTASLLPPLHLAVVRAEDVVEGMDGLWARMFAAHPDLPPRAACLICGPSRTADIEQTLVLGAHGPLAVHVALVG